MLVLAQIMKNVPVRYYPEEEHKAHQNPLTVDVDGRRQLKVTKCTCNHQFCLFWELPRNKECFVHLLITSTLPQTSNVACSQYIVDEQE